MMTLSITLRNKFAEETLFEAYKEAQLLEKNILKLRRTDDLQDHPVD